MAVTDDLPPEVKPTELKLLSSREMSGGTVWLRYRVSK